MQQRSAREALQIGSMEKRENGTKLDVGETRYLFYLVDNLRPFYLFSRKEKRKKRKRKKRNKNFAQAVECGLTELVPPERPGLDDRNDITARIYMVLQGEKRYLYRC
jgi:hypothetical protein